MLAGKSDLAEIAILCAVEAAVTIVAVVDPRSDVAQFVGIDVHKSYADVTAPFDAVVVTDVSRASQSLDAAVAARGADRVLAPDLLSCACRPGRRARQQAPRRGARHERGSGRALVCGQTQVNGEAKAAQNLIRQGFEIYLPRYLKRRRHARKIDFTAKPLFPRYMFVAIDVATQRWRSIQSTFGVSHLISNGDDPATVPAGSSTR